LHNNQKTNMPNHSESRTKRVFLNNIDSYSSKYIAQFLSSCVVGESLNDGEDKHELSSEATRFQIVGTVANKEAIKLQERLQCLMQCDVIVYNITEHTDLIDEATWAISGNNSSNFQTTYGCISSETHSDQKWQLARFWGTVLMPFHFLSVFFFIQNKSVILYYHSSAL
uniref:Uncharacterized protein n=1 Tax=Sinocyclocheilus anshuiensis TaxID=1608454 RepID=A0A671L022_9TELE